MAPSGLRSSWPRMRQELVALLDVALPLVQRRARCVLAVPRAHRRPRRAEHRQRMDRPLQRGHVAEVRRTPPAPSGFKVDALRGMKMISGKSDQAAGGAASRRAARRSRASAPPRRAARRPRPPRSPAISSSALAQVEALSPPCSSTCDARARVAARGREHQHWCSRRAVRLAVSARALADERRPRALVRRDAGEHAAELRAAARPP